MKKLICSMSVVIAMTAGAGLAKEGPNPVQQHNSNTVWFENYAGLSNTSMVVKAPNGVLSKVFAKKGTPVFTLAGKEIPDGVYRFELSAATEEVRKITNGLNNGRGKAARSYMNIPYILNGHFVVSRGVIVTPKEEQEK